MNKIKSLVEARKQFATQEACEKYLAARRWPNGVTCPRCASKKVHYLDSRHKWQCECRYQFSVTAGTIFHKTHIDLPRWLMAVWLMSHSPKGISSKQLQREIGLTYKSAWYLSHRIRTAMIRDQFGVKLSGIVEIDDAVVKSSKGTRWGGGSYVLGMASRDGDIKLKILQKLKGEEVRRVVAPSVDLSGSSITSARSIYKTTSTSSRSAIAIGMRNQG